MDLELTSENATAQKLLETFGRFRRHGWRQAPIEDLTPSEMALLFAIKRTIQESGTGAKVSDLSALLSVAPPTVTQQLNSLDARGYIARHIDPDDRRVIRVTVTESGEEIIRKAHHAFIESITGLVEYLGEADSETLADLMEKVYTYFQEASTTRGR